MKRKEIASLFADAEQLTEQELTATYKLRGVLATRYDSTETLIEMLRKSKNNEDLIEKADTWLKLYNNK
jgi:transcription termination factor Rho